MIESFFWRKFLIRNGLARLFPSLRSALDGAERVAHRYSDRTLAIPLAELQDPALLPGVQTPDSIDLASAMPRSLAMPGVGRWLPDHGEPPAWGLPHLRTDLAADFSLNHGAEHDPLDEVLITPGARAALAAILDAFVNPGDGVVLFDPCSPIFSIGLKHRRARLAWVRTWSEDGTLRFPMDRLVQAMRGFKLMVLSDPGNPSGAVLAAEDIEQIAFWAKKYDLLLVQDASFDRWRSRPARARLASLEPASDRLLTVGSLGISHGITLGRVGWVVGQRHLVRPVAGAMLLAGGSVPLAGQQLASQAMCGDGSTHTDADARRAYVADRLRGMGLEPWPSTAGLFFWCPTPGGVPGREFAQRLLSETGVLVQPGHPFGPSAGHHVRISFTTDEGRLREALERLERFVMQPAVTEPGRVGAG